MPETKGLSLEEMDQVFGDQGGSSVQDMERLMEIHKRIGLDAYAGSAHEGDDRKTSTEKTDVEYKA